MKWTDYLLAGAFLCVSGCAFQASGALVAQETRYRLVSVNGKPAGGRGFTILFAPSGTYSASFDCGEHFGRYSLGPRLVLQAGGTAPGACDEVDLRTGRQIVRQESFGTQFLHDQPFNLDRHGVELTLTGRRHRYVLAQ